MMECSEKIDALHELRVALSALGTAKLICLNRLSSVGRVLRILPIFATLSFNNAQKQWSKTKVNI
jgi:hypothetical protein